ncbi:MAG TPA: RNase adapter RapZ [Candidatus Lachnoclostridium stercorigallinarum]|uniref:RNase adapter RapZ n=1 Tax=Candidatus Lachnoclostridium stercorigallinarum TaxID=2838634 RepID=A0A9D2GEQ5_9FIRM|nr:RNase adapter RapZ [Candidatus Lachnoclostridium stercorigallinarum]
MKLVIVTGMSGAGKTVALKMFEDLGFYCVDNMPVLLMEKFVDLLRENSGEPEDVAMGVDIRSGDELSQLQEILDRWKMKKIPCQILFLDASDEVLIKRYKETRRNHPLAGNGRLDRGIAREREKVAFLKRQADYILDTSSLLTRELREELARIFSGGQPYENLFVTVLSFGFKYGIPVDADLVFDVRFLPNPYYVEELKYQTGEDARVREYVMQGGTCEKFLEKLYDMMEFLIPNYIKEGKNQLVIAVGCTGGKHRSVTVAGALYSRLKEKKELGVKLEHRDIDKDNKRMS